MNSTFFDLNITFNLDIDIPLAVNSGGFVAEVFSVKNAKEMYICFHCSCIWLALCFMHFNQSINQVHPALSFCSTWKKMGKFQIYLELWRAFPDKLWQRGEESKAWYVRCSPAVFIKGEVRQKKFIGPKFLSAPN